jgi:hypothetical protein
MLGLPFRTIQLKGKTGSFVSNLSWKRKMLVIPFQTLHVCQQQRETSISSNASNSIGTPTTRGGRSAYEFRYALFRNNHQARTAKAAATPTIAEMPARAGMPGSAEAPGLPATAGTTAIARTAATAGTETTETPARKSAAKKVQATVRTTTSAGNYRKKAIQHFSTKF